MSTYRSCCWGLCVEVEGTTLTLIAPAKYCEAERMFFPDANDDGDVIEFLCLSSCRDGSELFECSKSPSLKWTDTDSAMMKPKEEVSINFEDGRRWWDGGGDEGRIRS